MNSINSSIISIDTSRLPGSQYKAFTTDLTFKETLTGKTYATLMERQKKNNLPYLLAITFDNQFVDCFDALNLNRWLRVNPLNPISPKTKKKLTDIFFFAITSTQSDYHPVYIGSSTDIGSKKGFIETYLKISENNPKAMRDIAYYYFAGIDVEKNSNEAIRWWTLAAEKGDSDAQYMVGICYAEGYGVEKDLDEAIKWLELAMDQGDDDATKYLDELL